MKNIIIICTGNSCRSQIAHGYFLFYLENQANIYSAGVEKHGLNKNAIESMKRDGIDISYFTSNQIDEYLKIDFNYIITVCDHANESCPNFPTKKAIRIHKDFYDPSKKNNSDNINLEFDKCRDDIKKFALDFKKKYFKPV